MGITVNGGYGTAGKWPNARPRLSRTNIRICRFRAACLLHGRARKKKRARERKRARESQRANKAQQQHQWRQQRQCICVSSYRLVSGCQSSVNRFGLEISQQLIFRSIRYPPTPTDIRLPPFVFP